MEKMIGAVVLEDDPMVLELHRQYLSRVKDISFLGCAKDGDEGLKLIERVHPHLAIVDIYMPGLNGLELLKAIRAQGLNTDIILVTAAHDVDSVQQGIQYGAIDYIIKPFTFARFKKALDSYRQYFIKLRTSKRTMSQQEIDTLKSSSAGRVRENHHLPKGLQQNTLDLIVELIRDKSGYFTTREIAAALGISRVTVKRYLSFLQDNGCLKETLAYGPVGRPMQKFLVNKEMLH